MDPGGRLFNCNLKNRAGLPIAGLWKPLIINHLEQVICRYGELRRAIPETTQKMLTQQLRELEDDGLVEREVFPVVPPRVDSMLTDLKVCCRSWRPWRIGE